MNFVEVKRQFCEALELCDVRRDGSDFGAGEVQQRQAAPVGHISGKTIYTGVAQVELLQP